MTNWKDASYQEVAKLVLSAFLDDFTAEELDYCINNAYDSKFDIPAIAPLVKLDGQYNLELFMVQQLLLRIWPCLFCHTL